MNHTLHSIVYNQLSSINIPLWHHKGWWCCYITITPQMQIDCCIPSRDCLQYICWWTWTLCSFFFFFSLETANNGGYLFCKSCRIHKTKWCLRVQTIAVTRGDPDIRFIFPRSAFITLRAFLLFRRSRGAFLVVTWSVSVNPNVTARGSQCAGEHLAVYLTFTVCKVFICGKITAYEGNLALSLKRHKCLTT